MLPHNRYPGAVARDRDAVPIYSLVERRYGIKTRSVRQEIRAVAIAGDMASLLRVSPGSPGLSIQRQYFSSRDDVFEVSLSVHPADRYHYTMQLDLSLGRRPVGSEPG